MLSKVNWNLIFALQPAIEKTAKNLLKSDRDLMIQYLTDYSVMHAENVVEKWRELGKYLVMKYNDGYVKNDEGRIVEQGYSQDWLRKVIENRPNQFALPENKENPESKLID